LLEDENIWGSKASTPAFIDLGSLRPPFLYKSEIPRLFFNLSLRSLDQHEDNYSFNSDHVGYCNMFQVEWVWAYLMPVSSQRSWPLVALVYRQPLRQTLWE